MPHNATGPQFVSPSHYRILEMQHEELLDNASKIQGLFHFLNFLDTAAFDRCLGRSGKSPECLARAPEGGAPPRKFVAITAAGQALKAKQAEAERAALLGLQRQDQRAISMEETMDRLKDTFMAYADPMLYANTGRREMNIVGWCRLLRDCRLLDNRLTLVAADVIFTRVDAGVDVLGMPGVTGGTTLGDLHIDHSEFLRCLRAVVRTKFPTATDQNEALGLLARKWILPFSRGLGAGGGVGASVDGLFNRTTMNIVRTYDRQLKKLFAWYSGSSEADPARVNWSWVRDHDGTITSSQFVLMLLNFNVTPVLLSKNAAIEVFVRCESANDGDEKVGTMYYPTFLETLAEVALAVGEAALTRLRVTTSPDELKILRRYAEGSPPPHGPRVLQAHRDVLVGRGRDAPALDQHSMYDAEAERKKNEQRAAEALQRQEEAQMMGVVQRREGLRQRFALTRLRNFYRDVRTANNNTTWPPERDTSPTNRRPGNNANPGSEGEDPVHVAFFDSERAIKTPRPLWVPAAGHVPASRRFSLNAGYGPDSPAAAGIMLGGANMLAIDTPTGGAGPKGSSTFAATLGGGGGRPVGMSFAFGPPSPGAYGRTPKPYQFKVAIEDRDEYEAILSLAGRLPHIREPTGVVRDDPSSAGQLDASTSAADWQGRPRAVTAPAEMRSRGRARGSSPGAEFRGPEAAGGFGLQGAGGGGEGRAGMASVAEAEAGEGGASGEGALTTTLSRHRLPPVHHQLHRQQATASALAQLAGHSPPQPSHQQHHPHPAKATSLPHAGSPTAASVGPGAVARTGSYTGFLPLGPTPSQLAQLGILPPQVPKELYSPANSLSRRRAGRKTDAFGMPTGYPNLPSPGDTAPSVEVAAALMELDRFDRVY